MRKCERGSKLDDALLDKLLREGASERLARFICKLNEDLSLIKPKRRIDVENHKIVMVDGASPLAVIGLIDDITGFVYDSRLFDEYDASARTVFSQLFAEDYMRLLVSGISLLAKEEISRAALDPSILIPDLHYFVAKLDRRGKVFEVALYSTESELLAMASAMPSSINERVPFMQER